MENIWKFIHKMTLKPEKSCELKAPKEIPNGTTMVNL